MRRALAPPRRVTLVHQARRRWSSSESTERTAAGRFAVLVDAENRRVYPTSHDEEVSYQQALLCWCVDGSLAVIENH